MNFSKITLEVQVTPREFGKFCNLSLGKFGGEVLRFIIKFLFALLQSSEKILIVDFVETPLEPANHGTQSLC